MALTAAPSPAERARTVLAAGDSACVLVEGRRDLVHGIADDEDGGVVLHLGPRHPLVRHVAGAGGGDLAAVVEIGRATAVACRQRVRARLTLGGWLSADAGDPVLHLDPAEVVLADDVETQVVDLDAYRAAEPDCLARIEDAHLMHLAGQHPDTLALLARHAAEHLVRRSTRVVPVGLDRYGLVLRFERRAGHHDVRLPFDPPLRAPHDAADALAALIARATGAVRSR